nr:integrase, catalytic region, zinc finger, CCHC-type, peptidase aspartic, catalytic [Tanacetum cinerariifolium]
MWRKSFVKSKPNIYKNVRFLPVSNSISKSRQAYNVMTNNINHFKQIVDDAWIKHSKDLFCAPTAHDMEILIQTCLMPLAVKTHGDSLKFVHELKQAMHADLKYVESLEIEIDELKSEKAEFSDMYDVILQDYLKAQLQDKNIAISELKKLIEQGKGKSVDTKFDRPFVVRLPNAQRIPKPSVLGKPPFSYSLERRYFLKTKSIPKTNVLEGLSKPVTAHNLSQTAKKAVSNTNVLKPGMYIIDNRIAHTTTPQLSQIVRNTNLRVSTSTGVNHKPNVSIPQLKSNRSRDKVLPNNSQIVQLILFIVDSGCTKHMTGNLKLLCNFVEKFLGTVRFGNDQFAPILGYGDLVQGNVTINRVYYVEGLNHNLFSVDALAELQCIYLYKVKECDCLAQKLSKQTESVSKKVHTELLQHFAKVEKHSISLELALEKCKEQVKNDTVCNEKPSNVFRKGRELYFEIQDLKAQLQDKIIAISELKKLIEKGNGKSVVTKFDRPSVVRQPNAQRIPKPPVLGKPTPFSNSLERKYFPKTKSVPKVNVSESLSKPVTAQTLPQTTKKAINNTNVLKPRMYIIDNRTTHTIAPQLPQIVRNTNLRMSTSTGVNHKPNVSKP